MYHPTFNAFAKSILRFLNVTFPQKAKLWLDRLSDNFRPLQSPILQG
jgi:hypothetical protein